LAVRDVAHIEYGSRYLQLERRGRREVR
jgi:hypothetical protein